MKEKDFCKKHLKECLKDIKNFDDWKEEDYNTLIGYCNIIIADIKKIQSFKGE